MISGGSNIYPREVEEALLEHPSVEKAGVVGAPDPGLGTGGGGVHQRRPRWGPSCAPTCCYTSSLQTPKPYVFIGQLPEQQRRQGAEARAAESVGTTRPLVANPFP
jgi:acyl-CoA synthetase (AMP-forming)/AMP-acid ligase II